MKARMSIAYLARRSLRRCFVPALVLALVGCASPRNRAPVEDRAANAPRPITAPAVDAGVPTTGAITLPVDPGKPPPPGAENAGKPGYYSVKPGDTLIRVGLENGQNWKDLVKWNNLENPNILEVGQVLRVVAPGTDPAQASPRGATMVRMDPRPLDGKASAPGTSGTSPAVSASAVAPAVAVAVATPPPSREGDDDINWLWPTSSPVTSSFEDGKSKGLVFAGKAGDPVLAAADGRVVYAGSGLRGYGNLVILKHNSTYLTAYAHNQTLLVKEDQTVRRGQKIAEMGSTDADRVQLHFEIRKQGKPVDPAKLLPAR